MRAVKTVAAVLLGVAGSLLGVVGAAIATVALVGLDWVAEQATTALGREVDLDQLTIDWSWPPRVTIDGLSIANAEWGSRPDMATIARLAFEVDLPALLRGRVILPSLAVRRPDVLLETRDDGFGNWQLPNDEDDGPAILPIVHHIEMERATIVYQDGRSDLELEATIAALTGRSDDAALVLSGEGVLEGKDYRLDLTAGALAALQQPEEPYPIDLDLALGGTEITASGTVRAPLALAGLDLSVAIGGPDLAELVLIDALPIPSTPNYALAGSLKRDDDSWRFEDFDGRLGGSDLRGSLAVDLSVEPLMVEADVVADVLDVGELRAVFGVPPAEVIVEEAAADDGLIVPDEIFDVAILGRFDGRVMLRVKRLIVPGIPLDDFVAELTIDGAVLRVQPAEFGVAGGIVRTFLSFYGDKEPFGLDVLSHIRDVGLKPFFRDTEFVQEMAGKINGKIELSGRGASAHTILASSDGAIDLVMSDGQISAIILELIGIDIAEALTIYMGDDVPLPIRCLVTDLAIESGVVKPRNLLLDTRDTLITGTGQLDLGEEALELTLLPEPKDFTMLSLRSKVHVEGRLADLSVAPDLASMLELLPPIDLGTAEDAPCAQLVERVRQEEF